MIIQRTEVYVKERLLGGRFEYIELYREYYIYICIFMFYCYLKILGKSSNLTKTCFKLLGKKDQLMFWVSDYLDYPPSVIQLVT